MKDKTICIKCGNYASKSTSNFYDNICYSHFCGAVKFDEVIDYVTGEITLVDKNGIPQKFDRPFCKDINTDGNCPMFKEN